jgi:dipeptidyl aminopeptidase/acylaminoacyl peptidase
MAPFSLDKNIPTQNSHQAVLDTSAKEYLLDAKQGTIQGLDLAGEAFPYVAHFRFSGGGKRWMLMGNPQGGLTYLVNLETGQVHDMTTLNQDTPWIFYGLFAPDEAHLLMGVGSDLWLIPTANLDAARRLGAGKTTFTSSFSGDGKQVAYVQRSGSGEFEVALEAVDGSKSEVVTTDTFIAGIAFVPGQKQLILLTEKQIFLLSLEDGAKKELLALSGQARRPWLTPDGKKALIQEETTDSILWHLVDLKQSQVQLLDELQGYSAYFWNPDHRWVFCVDNTSYGAGGHNFVSLDLESGEIKSAMDVDEELMYMGLSDVAAEGRYALVTTMNPDNQMQLWLLRAGGGEPRLLAEAGSVSGAFSPDGRWVAVSTQTRTDDDGFETQVTLMEIEGDETRSVGEGVRPIWVRP